MINRGSCLLRGKSFLLKKFLKNEESRFVMSWKWVSLAGSHIFTKWENVSKQSHFLLQTSMADIQFLIFK